MTAKLTAALWRNDLLPVLTLTATYGDATPVDLSAATSPTFLMRPAAGGDNIAPAGTVSIVDGPAGIVSYAWGDGDTDVAGRYHAQIEVLIGGKPITFPGPDQTLEVIIREDLG